MRRGSELKRRQNCRDVDGVASARETIHARLVSAPTALFPGAGEWPASACTWQYQQSCMLISVECADDPSDYSTLAAVLPGGPRAFLPLFCNHWASLVWYDARRGSVSCRA